MKVSIVAISAAIVFAIAWGGQKGQVARNTIDIKETKTIVDANKTCITRMETRLETIQNEQTLFRTDMKEGFRHLEQLITGSP